LLLQETARKLASPEQPVRKKEAFVTVCGIEMAASEARLVILDGMKDNYSYIAVKPPKIDLTDDENPEEVKAFQDAIYAFFRENKVDKVAIKKRSKRGEYAGGPVSFKLEAIVQLYSECEIVLVSPQAIAAAKRKHTPAVPSGCRKYQQAAFETAFAAMS
jgi:hypothetical protein